MISAPRTSMSVNKDLNYVFSWTRQCLQLLGVWPDPHMSVNQSRLSNLRYMFAMCIISLYVFIPQATNIFRVWGNLTLILECIASVNYSSMAICKLIVTRYYNKILQTLMTSVTTDWMTSRKNWQRDTMLKVTKTGRSLAFSCYAALIGGTMFHLFFNFLKFKRSIHQSERKLVYQFVYPYYNVQKTANYVITFFIQLMAGVYVALINTTIDTFVSLLLMQICSQLINLRMELNELIEKMTKKSIPLTKFKEGLVAIVLRHEHLIRNAKMIDDCYNIVLLIHLLAATFQMCFEIFQAYTILTAKNVDVLLLKMMFLVMYAMMVLTHLHFYCYSAETLLVESTNLAYGVYKCKWYDLPPKDAKDLMFIVYRSMIPLRLTAGKFNTFSMEMFGTTLKTSMGYLSLLLTMKD